MSWLGYGGAAGSSSSSRRRQTSSSAYGASYSKGGGYGSYSKGGGHASRDRDTHRARRGGNPDRDELDRFTSSFERLSSRERRDRDRDRGGSSNPASSSRDRRADSRHETKKGDGGGAGAGGRRRRKLHSYVDPRLEDSPPGGGGGGALASPRYEPRGSSSNKGSAFSRSSSFLKNLGRSTLGRVTGGGGGSGSGVTSRTGSPGYDRYGERKVKSDPASGGTGGGRAAKGKKGKGAKGKGDVCDKCDSKKHLTADCPWYKKPRDKHPDAQKGKGKSIGGDGGNFTLRSGRVVRQPGDGSCLFHSLAYGLGGSGARALRREIAAWVGKNPTLRIADTPLSDWVKWDSRSSVSAYARRMASGGWGGGIEMAAFSRLKRVNVHVYERKRGGGLFSRRGRGSSGGAGGFKRISCFDYPGARKTVHVLYCGGVHYDALVPG